MTDSVIEIGGESQNVHPSNKDPAIVKFRTSVDIPRAYEEFKQRISIEVEKRTSVEIQRHKQMQQKLQKLKEKNMGDYQANEHTLNLEQVAEELHTEIDVKDPKRSKGLKPADAKNRLAINGKNLLTPPKETHPVLVFLKHLLNPFMVLLELAGVLCLVQFGIQIANFDAFGAQVVYLNLFLAIFLFVVAIITSSINFAQERKSSKLMAGFKNLVPQYCRVLRDGVEHKILAEEVVVGDILLISAGDKVAADVRIVESDGLMVDNSSLTGESEPQPRIPKTTSQNPLETQNLAFFGTLAVDGAAVSVVIRTGDNTLIGKIATLAIHTQQKPTTMELEVRRVVTIHTILAISLGAIFLTVGLIRKPNDVNFNILNLIGVLVANVPEGLPSTVAACLTICATRLAAKKVFVKKLDCIETLGATSCICTDKTGTLTQNRMTAVHAYLNESFFSLHNVLDNFPRFDEKDPIWQALMKVARTCLRASFDPSDTRPVDDRSVLGDASETAILRFCEKLETIQKTRDQYPKLFEIPFNSANKFQLSIHSSAGSEAYFSLKGAPEIILSKCSHILIKEGRVPLTEEWKNKTKKAVEKLAEMGERVLGFAFKEDKLQTPYTVENVAIENLTFVGLISLIDPPREGVPKAIQICKEAHIKVNMVTGDHPSTAKAIAKQIGLITLPTREEIAKQKGVSVDRVPESEAKAIVLTGDQLRNFTKDDWNMVTTTKQECVFARTSPQQKLQIVKHFQKSGDIVAVTGDGVNDSPALKKANIGVAMGIAGSEVAKESADIILMDDDFSSIVRAVEEGRIIFDNIKKSTIYTISHLFCEVLVFLISYAFAYPVMLSSQLILLIDCGTELFPAISLSHEKAEEDIMNRPPRDTKRDKLLSWQGLFFAFVVIGFIESGSAIATFVYVMGYFGFPASVLPNSLDYWMTSSPDLVINGVTKTAQEQFYALAVGNSAYFLSIVINQMGVLFACRTRSVSIFTHGFTHNRYFNISFIVAIIIAILVIYVPPFNYILINDQILGGAGWAWLIPVPFTLLIIFQAELRKWWCRRYPNGFAAKFLQW